MHDTSMRSTRLVAFFMRIPQRVNLRWIWSTPGSG
jgi:hypothetical protein